MKKQKEKPQVYAVKKGKKGWNLSRRSFISGAAAAGAALLASGAKKKAEAVPMAPSLDCIQPLAHTDVVNCLAFSSDGKLLFSGSDDNKVKVWEVTKQGLIKVLTQHTANVNAVAASPNGKYFLTGSADNKIIVWNVSNLSVLRKFSKHVNDVIGIGITPDSSRVVSVDSAGHVKFWNLPGGGLVSTWDASGYSYSMAISPNGSYVAVGHWATISVWSLKPGETGKLVAQFGDHSGPVSELAFTNDNSVLVSGGTKNTYMKMWSIPSGTMTKQINAANVGCVNSLAMSAGGPYMASGGKKGYVKLWNVPQGTLRHRFMFSGVNATSLAISPDGTLVAIGQDDGKIRLCRVLTHEFLGCFIDITVNSSQKSAIKYNVNINGKMTTVTVPDCHCAPPMPPGAVCVCNTVPGACSCVGDTCSCVGHTCSCQGHCSCDGYTYHYWYPN